MRSILNLFAKPSASVHSLYQAVVSAARRPEWYRGGKIADDLDGRFAVLSTLLALTMLRMERGDEDCVRASVHLTEAFIADMDAQMREEGFGDPSIGKQVRSLVGALASRVDRWRAVALEGPIPAGSAFDQALLFSLYRDKDPGEAALTLAADEVRDFHDRLDGLSDRTLVTGDWH